jgi:hypothetical protein
MAGNAGQLLETASPGVFIYNSFQEAKNAAAIAGDDESPANYLPANGFNQVIT